MLAQFKKGSEAVITYIIAARIVIELGESFHRQENIRFDAGVFRIILEDASYGYGIIFMSVEREGFPDDIAPYRLSHRMRYQGISRTRQDFLSVAHEHRARQDVEVTAIGEIDYCREAFAVVIGHLDDSVGHTPPSCRCFNFWKELAHSDGDCAAGSRVLHKLPVHLGKLIHLPNPLAVGIKIIIRLLEPNFRNEQQAHGHPDTEGCNLQNIVLAPLT